MVPHSTS